MSKNPEKITKRGKTMKRTISVLLVLCMLLAVCSACASSTPAASPAAPANEPKEPTSEAAPTETPAEPEIEAITLKLGTTGPAPGDDVYVASVAFADAIEKVSDGKIKVEVVGSGALGTTAQHYAQLKEGSLDFFTTAFDTATTMVKGEDFAVVACPYLFRDIDHYEKFLNSDMLKEMLAPVEEANNVVYLGPLGFRLPRGLNCIFPIHSVDDVKNLKIRTPDTVSTQRVWEAMGANPMIIAASDLYTSLQSGICDAQENDYKTSYNNGWMEAAHYYMELDYIQQGNVLYISGTTWSKLNDQQKEWISTALAEAHKNFNADAEKALVDMRDKIAADGYEFVEDVDVQSFRDKAAEVVETLDGSLWTAGLVEKIRAIE